MCAAGIEISGRVRGFVMHARAFALVAFVALVATSTSGAAEGPVVQTTAGTVEGERVDGVVVFRGLPYAAAPVGPLRWREPQPVRPWRGLRSAKTFGAACPQKAGLSLEGGGDPGPQSEDCLYLNVWAPPAAADQRRPVLVWLHGGALIFGAGGLPLYDGRTFAQQGVIVVTINYRLGPLGYFVHPALEHAAPGGPANFGLFDQIAALRWVRENIAAFGGDAARVTVAGQSAGAQSVLALMTSPPARGLFQQAIAESAYGIPAHTRAKARQTGIDVAEAVGLPGARATAAALRAVPAERLAELEGHGLSLAPSPIVGDAALPHPILDAFAAKHEMAVPLLIGSNSDDASVVRAFGVDPALLVKRLGAAHILVRPLYPGVDDDAELGRQVARDVVFTAFARRVAVLHGARAPTWRYWFDAVAGRGRNAAVGAAHGGEVPAVFGTGDRCDCLATLLDDDDRRTWQGVNARWVAFARSGDPAVDGAPSWPVDLAWRPVTMEFGDAQVARPAFMARRLNAFIVALKLVARARPSD